MEFDYKRFIEDGLFCPNNLGYGRFNDSIKLLMIKELDGLESKPNNSEGWCTAMLDAVDKARLQWSDDQENSRRSHLIELIRSTDSGKHGWRAKVFNFLFWNG